MAKYLMLIYENESAYAKATPEDYQRVMDLHNAYPAQVEKLGGQIINGQALQPTNTATTIRGDVVTDGPFAETKEALGGYYLVEAEDLDMALAIGKVTPAPYGSIEVRPIMVFE